MRAKQLGIPLGILLMLLRDLGQTGEVHFTIAEPITPKMAILIDECGLKLLMAIHTDRLILKKLKPS